MSKKSDPQSYSGPRRRPRTAPRPQSHGGASGPGVKVERIGNRASSTTIPAKKKKKNEQKAAPVTFWGRVRAFFPWIALPSLFVIVLSVAAALVILIALKEQLSAIPTFVAQFWLVVNLVPVKGGNITLGFLPMVPAAIYVWTISRQIRRLVNRKVSVADLRVIALCTLVFPLLLSGIAAFMLVDASAVYKVAPPEFGSTVLRVLLLHSAALIMGMGIPLWRALFRRYGLPEWLVYSVNDAYRVLKLFICVSAVVFLGSVAIHYSAFTSILGTYPTRLGAVAAVIVSLLYLPNFAIDTGAVLSGTEVTLGQGSVSLFGVNLVPLPPLPAFAGIPAHVQSWAAVLLVIPALCIIYCTYRFLGNIRSTVVTAVCVGLFTLGLSFLAGGTMGIYGNVGAYPVAFAAAIAGWTGVVGVLSVGVVSIIATRRGVAPTIVSAEDSESGPEPGEEQEVLGTSVVDDADADSDPAESAEESIEEEETYTEAESEEGIEGEVEEIVSVTTVESVPEEPEEFVEVMADVVQINSYGDQYEDEQENAEYVDSEDGTGTEEVGEQQEKTDEK